MTEQTYTRWQKLKLVARVIEVRLRFVAVLVAVGMLIGYWDTIKNHWDKWTRPAAVATHQLPAGREFYCPMHPKVIRSGFEPDGSVPRCPICGMPLSERSVGESEPLPEGVTSRVQLSPDRIQLAGVATVEIGYRPMSRQVTTVGTVAFDESRLSRVVSRVNGYVEKLYVNQTFMKVARGDRLAEIYSPELYSTAQEMLSASRGTVAHDLAQSARRRLELFGVSDREIQDIEKSGTAMPKLVIRSPQAGFVTRKEIVTGSRVSDGMTLLEIADLSSVWIEADVYERDISLLRKGQAIEASVDALPGRAFHGTVSLVYPEMDAATRTNRVRFDVANPDAELRPGMFATVRINVPIERPMGSGEKNVKAGEFLVVPERAVIDTGTRQVVYVERRPGVFEGVLVKLGPRNGEFYPVFEGLKAGQRVVAAGAFLIDAETRLNPAAAGTYYGASGGPHKDR